MKFGRMEMIQDAVLEFLRDSYEESLGKNFQLTVSLYDDPY